MLGATAAGLVTASSFYLGYRFGKYRARFQPRYRSDGFGKSYETQLQPLSAYVTRHNTENAVLSQLRALSLEHQYGEMTSPVEVGKLLTILVKSLNSKKVIDIGVFTGCSAFAMALGLPDGCQVVACDISDEYTSLGKPYWEEGGVSDKIDLRLQPATKTLQELIDGGESGTYDLLFIDADKPNYGKYYELGLQLLRTGGLVVVDNALWDGRVANPQVQDPNTTAIRKLNETMKRDTRVEFVLLKIADGIAIAQKLPPWE